MKWTPLLARMGRQLFFFLLRKCKTTWFDIPILCLSMSGMIKREIIVIELHIGRQYTEIAYLCCVCVVNHFNLNSTNINYDHTTATRITKWYNIVNCLLHWLAFTYMQIDHLIAMTTTKIVRRIRYHNWLYINYGDKVDDPIQITLTCSSFG